VSADASQWLGTTEIEITSIAAMRLMTMLNFLVYNTDHQSTKYIKNLNGDVGGVKHPANDQPAIRRLTSRDLSHIRTQVLTMHCQLK